VPHEGILEKDKQGKSPAFRTRILALIRWGIHDMANRSPPLLILPLHRRLATTDAFGIYARLHVRRRIAFPQGSFDLIFDLAGHAMA
jgi:hypothetical protein